MTKKPFGHRWSWCKAGETLQNLFGHRVEVAPGRFFIFKNKKTKKQLTSLLYSQNFFFYSGDCPFFGDVVR